MNVIEEQRRNRELFKMAVDRMSLYRLDSLGICVKMQDLESYLVLKVCRNNFYGTNRLSRFWCQVLRPRLRYDDHLVAKAALDQAYQYQRREFLAAIMERGFELGYTDKMICGHNKKYVVQGDEGTAYCSECERQANSLPTE